MALLFSKSSFYRTAILLGLVVSLAGGMPGAPGAMPAPAATSPAQATTPAADAEASQAVPRVPSDQELTPLPLSEKQKRNLMKANFEKMKRDAGELADLAKALQQELNKSNENILSLDVVEKADKIEKLARRIKGTARGF
jgi:cell division protein FtsN